MQRRSALDGTAMIVMTLLCFTWGLQQVAIKITNEGISPLLQAGIRSAGATVLVMLWSRHKGISLVQRDGTLLPGIVAAALFAAEFAMIYWGLGYTTASRAVIFLYTAPFVVALGAHLFLPGERLRPLQWAGLVLAFCGIGAAFADGLRFPSQRELTGDLMILAAALFWGATTIVIKATPLIRISPNKTLFYQLAGSALALPLVSMALGEPGIIRVTPLIAASMAYQIVIVAFISYLAWFWLVAHYPAAQLSAFSFLTPLFGMLGGWLLLAERITPALTVAMVLVACGIYLVNKPQRRA